MHIVNQCEDYTEEAMATLLPVFEQLGFARIVAHIAFCTSDDQTLKANTAYFNCQFEGMPKDTHDHCKTRMQLTTTLPMQREYNRRHPLIEKNILFTTVDDEIIGWYNREQNILWLSDLFHDKEEGGNPLLRVLGTVKEVKQMIEQCQDCHYCRSEEQASKALATSLCRIYEYPERQHTRLGGCPMRTHGRIKTTGEKGFIDPLKLSKRTQRGVKS